jgi:hypothetical protein
MQKMRKIDDIKLNIFFTYIIDSAFVSAKKWKKLKTGVR